MLNLCSFVRFHNTQSRILNTFRAVTILKELLFPIKHHRSRNFNFFLSNLNHKHSSTISKRFQKNTSIVQSYKLLLYFRRTTSVFTAEKSLYHFRNRNVYCHNVFPRFISTKEETKKKVQKKLDEIKENILTIPNGLCALRIVSTPFLCYLVLSEFYATSLGLFICAGFTDLVDGYIARNFPNQQSMIGSFLDPAADKLLIATLVVTLTVNGLIPIPLTSLIIFRDACLMGAGFYIRYVSLPPPKTLSRYFDMSFATAKLSPTTISKANTFLQLTLVAASLAAPVFSYIDHLYLHILWYITGTTTVLSAVSYMYYNHSTYKLLTKSDKEKK